MGERREVAAAILERYRAAGCAEKGHILDELTATTGWYRMHAVRALRMPALTTKTAASPSADVPAVAPPSAQLAAHRRQYAGIRDALIALWEASDRVCEKRLKVMIPALRPALETLGRLSPSRDERALILAVSAATIDPATFGLTQVSIVQRLLRTSVEPASTTPYERPEPVDGTTCGEHSAPPTGPPSQRAGNIPS